MSLEKITRGDEQTKSLDLVSENINKLRELFPEIVTEGKIDFKALQEILGEELEEGEEYYRFTWAGKAQARREAHKPSTGTLRPCKEDSVDWDTTQNLYIEGDNLEVLKLLQKSYANKVKMIYIDPPYNTGKDFVYKDNYKDNLKNYHQVTGQVDDGGNKLSTNSDSDGRYHSNWLNMMYPRLRLARNLLKEDGVIFISIDDNEVNNLIKIGCEIFGDENFVTQFIWKKKQGGGNDSNYIVVEHEYIVCFSKNKTNLSFNLDKNYVLDDALYPFKDDKGEYGLVTLDKSSIRFSESLVFEIKDENGRAYAPRIVKGKQSCWRWGKDKVEKDYDQLVFKNDKVYTKYYRPDGITPKSLLIDPIYGRTETGNDDIKKLFDNSNPFSYPKPLALIKHFLMIGSSENDLILDFFSGSGTCAHAVFEINLKDMSNRNFIQVQLPENIDALNYNTICDVGKERIRRAGKKIAEENPEKAKDLDLGFKVFKLDSSNIKGWDGNPDDLEASLFDAQENIKADRTEEDVLFEILLKYGLDLTLPIDEKLMDGKKVFSVGFGALFICLADDITNKVAEGIGAWKQELNPATCRVIFKDSGFSDVEKANAVQTLKRFGINEVKSI